MTQNSTIGSTAVVAILAAALISVSLPRSAQAADDGVFRMTIAAATSQNSRNSESDIIALKDGRLLLGWTEFYAGNGADDGAARIVGRVSADGGRTWGEKYTLVENDGGCNVMEVNFLRLKKGDIALFHCQKNVEASETTVGDCRVIMRVSKDEGKTFGSPKELTGANRYVQTASGRSLMLRSGRIVIECDNLSPAFCLLSDDDGVTWREGQTVSPPGGECHEPAAFELKDGRVLMFLRTGLGGQYQAISADGGETWSEATLSALRGTAAPIAIERIPKTGDLLAIWNHDVGSPRSRTPLTAAISRDDGTTWEHFRNIEDADDDGWAYPSCTWVGDRALVTYFNYQGGNSLFLKGIPLEWFYK
ncbi:MAG: sialidase family protein [Planctomycetota bacterium]|nr:sialidase family protein [Planctomycetota bacterium]MDA1179413.1 sialidase family protein [Planctomycetota bacterium]